MADKFQAGRPALQMSSWPGTVIPRRQTSQSSRVRVLKVSVSLTICSPYPTLNLPVRRPSFSSRRCTNLEQSSAAYHICCVTSRLLLLLEDILLLTLLPVITVVVPVKFMVRYSSVYRPTRHIIGHFGDDFTGQMTQTTVS